MNKHKISQKMFPLMWVLAYWLPSFDPVKAIVTFGDTIYTNGNKYTDDILAHELEHCRQHRYSKVIAFFCMIAWLLNKQYRYTSELKAYQAQYRYAQTHYRPHEARQILEWCSRMLSHPAYGFSRSLRTNLRAVEQGGHLSAEIIKKAVQALNNQEDKKPEFFISR